MSLPPESTLEEVKVRIREAVNKKSNVGRIEQVELKSGPRSFRLATLWEILNPETNEFHHYSLKIESINRNKKGWFYNPEKSISLVGKEPDEIQRLFYFLKAHLEGKLSELDGEIRIVKSKDYEKLERLIDLLPNLTSPDMVELIKLIIPRIKEMSFNFEEFVKVFEKSESETIDNIGVASRYVSHKRNYERLKSLVESGDTVEQKYQDILKENAWMFGSEYSELLDRRRWSRDDNLDFMLRRTSDNYLEIVEIKVPFDDALFLKDKSHESYYPSSKLSPVLGQVMRYIAEVERDRNSIISQDGVDPFKIRARIIIGRDHDSGHQEAIRNFNSYLHGIEIITFDQLVRIAKRVLDIFEKGALDSSDEESILETEDGPF